MFDNNFCRRLSSSVSIPLISMVLLAAIETSGYPYSVKGLRSEIISGRSSFLFSPNRLSVVHFLKAFIPVSLLSGKKYSEKSNKLSDGDKNKYPFFFKA